jgi:hypothetical protein
MRLVAAATAATAAAPSRCFGASLVQRRGFASSTHRLANYAFVGLGQMVRLILRTAQSIEVAINC